MKKGLSLLLAALLALTLTTAALADPYYLEAAGVTIEVPEGMMAQDASDESSYALIILPEGREDLVYMYALYYVEDLADKNMEDLDEEEAIALLAGFFEAIEDPTYDILEAEGINYLIIANGAGSELHYVAVLNGWITDVLVMNMAGDELTDEEIDVSVELVQSIVYDEAEETP